MMNVCMSLDHRVIDGAVASGFLSDLKKRSKRWPLRIAIVVASPSAEAFAFGLRPSRRCLLLS